MVFLIYNVIIILNRLYRHVTNFIHRTGQRWGGCAVRRDPGRRELIIQEMVKPHIGARHEKVRETGPHAFSSSDRSGISEWAPSAFIGPPVHRHGDHILAHRFGIEVMVESSHQGYLVHVCGI